MANWFVRINHRKDQKGDLFTETVERKLYFDIETKKEILTKVKEDYPEYFVDKVPQRTANGEHFYVNIYELDDYWQSFWLEEIPCLFCGENPVRRIDKKNHKYVGGYFCCLEHANEYEALRAEEDYRVYHRGGVVGFIYKITHKETGKVYIGKTVNHPIFRWFQHFKAQSGSRFHEEMKNSNITDWTYEVIDELKKGTENELLSLESQYISKYNATDPDYGYNTKD